MQGARKVGVVPAEMVTKGLYVCKHVVSMFSIWFHLSGNKTKIHDLSIFSYSTHILPHRWLLPERLA